MSILNNDILEKIVTHSENSILYYQKTDLSLICSTWECYCPSILDSIELSTVIKFGNFHFTVTV